MLFAARLNSTQPQSGAINSFANHTLDGVALAQNIGPCEWMSSDYINDPKHWLARAAEMREIAGTMAEDGIKASMLRLANDYDKLAASAIAQGAKE
jgi:hypothetical protein